MMSQGDLGPRDVLLGGDLGRRLFHSLSINTADAKSELAQPCRSCWRFGLRCRNLGDGEATAIPQSAQLIYWTHHIAAITARTRAGRPERLIAGMPSSH